MYHAKNCYVKIDNTEMEYVTFGNGTQPFIIIPGLGDALKTVRGTAVPFSYMYRTYAKYFKDIFIDTAEKTYSEQKLKTYRRFYGILSKMSEPRSLERFIIQGNACMAHDARPWLGKIQVPTLIVGGERDYIVGNKAAYELAENISDCKLKIYEKYGHGVFEEAKDFNDLVLKFLV